MKNTLRRLCRQIRSRRALALARELIRSANYREAATRCLTYLDSPAGLGLTSYPLDAGARFWTAWPYPENPDGPLELTQVFLPGQTAEEILLVASLAGDQPEKSAYGAAAAVEAMRALSTQLTQRGVAPLRRGVRLLFLSVPSSLYAYLSGREDTLDHLACGLYVHLPQVHGGRCAPLLLHELPEACPSIESSVAALVLDTVREVLGGAHCPHPAPFNADGGHAVLSDPTVGVPTPCLAQWSSSCPATIPPQKLLEQAAAVVACYAYAMSNLEGRDLAAVANKLLQRYHEECARLTERALAQALPIDAVYGLLGQKFAFFRDCCEDARRFVGENTWLNGPLDQAAAAMTAYQALNFQLYRSAMHPAVWLRAGEHIDPDEQAVPVRRYRGPARLADLAALSQENQAAYAAYRAEHPTADVTAETLTQFYIDGERSIGQIQRALDLERPDASPRLARDLIGLLDQFGLVAYRETC